MAEPEWGQKRKCPSCDIRFYDLTNNPTTCPSCGESFALEALSERKSHTSSRSRVKAPVVAKVVPVVVDDVFVIVIHHDGHDFRDHGRLAA